MLAVATVEGRGGGERILECNGGGTIGGLGIIEKFAWF